MAVKIRQMAGPILGRAYVVSTRAVPVGHRPPLSGPWGVHRTQLAKTKPKTCGKICRSFSLSSLSCGARASTEELTIVGGLFPTQHLCPFYKAFHHLTEERSISSSVSLPSSAEPQQRQQGNQGSPLALNNHRSPIRTKTASEQSSPNSEKSPRKLRELIKRNAGFMGKASAIMCARASRGFWS